MTDVTNINNYLTIILRRAAEHLNLDKYTLNLNSSVEKCDGFLGEFYKSVLRDIKTGNEINVIVKKAPTESLYRLENNIECAYKNEIYFYATILPAFRRFQLQNQVPNPFSSIPDYVTSDGTVGSEAIVFKDITKLGYVLRNKECLLDDEHVKLIFKTYGRFHAISFCMRHLHAQQFEELIKPIYNNWAKLLEKTTFLNILSDTQSKAYDSLDSEKDENIMEKFKKYKTNTKQIFGNLCQYHGRYYGLLHGDCWSNNMMFKYENNQDTASALKDINIFDFQLIRIGSPVYDLAYFFYTGGSKDIFDKLEDYLNTYHDSFSHTAQQFNCKADDLMPREILTQEWKEHAKFGMLLAILFTKIKLISKESSEQMMETTDNPEDNIASDQGKTFINIPFDRALFKKRVRDILVHLSEIDAL